MKCCSYVVRFHSSVLGSDFGLLDGQQVGSGDCDDRAATVHTEQTRYGSALPTDAHEDDLDAGLQDLLEDGPVGLDARDGRVLGVDVFGLRVHHLSPVNHQPDRGGAGGRQRGGSYADYFPIGPPAWRKRNTSHTFIVLR